jgi:WD40 repeat protein
LLVALKENLKSVPEYVKSALNVPWAPPQLGALKSDWVSYSSFYKNHPVLDSAAYPYADSCDPKLWRPKGVLVATLAEHKAAVTSLAVARDNLFLVSGAEDGTVKIWDSGRLKLTAHARSQWTHPINGRITSVAVCDSSHSVAAASSNGSLHVFKIEYAQADAGVGGGGGMGGDQAMGPVGGGAGGGGGGVGVPATSSANRYQGLSDVFRLEPDDTTASDSEGAMLSVAHFNTLSESLLVYATQKAVHGWDLRSRHAVFELRLEPSWGVLTTMSLGPTPFVLITGSSRGFIVVWDLRFQIPVQVWRHSAKTPITSLTSVDHMSILPRELPPQWHQPGQPPRQSLQHPTKGPLFFAAAEGTNQISGFDIYTGENRMLLRVLNSTGTDSSSLGASGAGVGAGAPVGSSAAAGAGPPPLNRRESLNVAAAASAYPNRARQKVHVSPLSLPSLRSYMREADLRSAGGGVGQTASFPPPYSSSSGFYQSIVNTTLDDAFLKEFAAATPETTASTGAGGTAVPAPPVPLSIRSFLLCRDFFTLTSGSDRVVRFWDLRDPADSYRISAPELGSSGSGSGSSGQSSGSSAGDEYSHYLRYNSRVENTTVVLEEVLSNQIPVQDGSATGGAGGGGSGAREERARHKAASARRTQGQQSPSPAHASDILDMKAIEFPQKMLATAGRDGVIKIWI